MTFYMSAEGLKKRLKKRYFSLFIVQSTQISYRFNTGYRNSKYIETERIDSPRRAFSETATFSVLESKFYRRNR